MKYPNTELQFLYLLILNSVEIPNFIARNSSCSHYNGRIRAAPFLDHLQLDPLVFRNSWILLPLELCRLKLHLRNMLNIKTAEPGRDVKCHLQHLPNLYALI